MKKEINMETAIKGFVHSIESFGSVDGPGIRYISFYMDARYAVNSVIIQILGLMLSRQWK